MKQLSSEQFVTLIKLAVIGRAKPMHHWQLDYYK